MKNQNILKLSVTLLLLFLIINTGWSQSTINYQGVVLDNSGKPLAEESITVTISINEPDYIYTSDVTTSILGAFSIEVPVDDIDFTEDIDYIMKSSITTSEGTVVTESKLAQVPLALVAEQAKGLVGITEIDQSPTNELQILRIDGNKLSIEGGNTVNLPSSGGNSDGDADPNNEVQKLSVTSNDDLVSLGLSLTGETISFSIADGDADNKNEVQTLSINNGSLILSGATGNPSSINISNLGDGTEDADADPNNEIQSISKNGPIVSLSQNGGSFRDDTEDADADPSNELQQISKSGNTITLSSGGGSIEDEVNDADADASNELQNLAINGHALSISNGNTVNIPTEDADADPSNEIQVISKTGNTITLSDGGGTIQDEVNDADADATNEIQTLNINGNLLSITNGNTVNIPTEDADADPSNEIQVISKTGNTITLSDGGGTIQDEVNDADANATNEIQNITSSTSGSVVLLALDNGGNSTSFSIKDGDPYDDNEIQSLHLNGTILGLSDDPTTVDLASIASPWMLSPTGSNSISYNNGNVGIGVSAPSVPLEVNGTGGFSGQLFVQQNLYANSNIIALGTVFGPAAIINDVEVSDELVVLGKLGVGTNSPFYDLDVDGSARIIDDLYVDNDLDVIGDLEVGVAVINETLNVYGEVNTYQDIVMNGGNKILMDNGFSFNSNGINGIVTKGDLIPDHTLYDLGNNTSSEHWDDVVADDFILFSDRRLKENINPLSSTLSDLLKLKPVSYRYKSSHSRDQRTRAGFIAQDLLKVFPESVITEDIDVDIKTGAIIRTPVEHYGVNYMELIPVAIKSIQEQQEIIDHQQTQITALQAELQSIKSLILKTNKND